LPIIDVPETKRPSFLSQGVFVNQSLFYYTHNEVYPYPSVWNIELVIFYGNRTAREWSFLSQHKLNAQGLDSLLDNYFLEAEKVSDNFKVMNDTLLINSAFEYYRMGPISFMTNDTITISSISQDGTSFNLSSWFVAFDSQYRIDTIEKKLYRLEPIGYYKNFHYKVINSDSVYKRSTSQLPLKSTSGKLVYDFYPYKIPAYERRTHINYWHPFKVWSAHLDSINAGLIPPDVPKK
jgi:hypothetical protein